MNQNLMRRDSVGRSAGLLALCLLLSAPLLAVTVPQRSNTADELFVRHDDLYISNVYQPVGSLSESLAAELTADLQSLGVAPGSAFYDLRGARWGTLVLSRPLVPGTGAGNSLTWPELGREAPEDDAALADAVWTAFTDFVAAHQGELGIDPGQLPERGGVAVHDGGRVVQIHAGREVAGVPVRDSYVSAVVNGGNLVLLGARNWGDVTLGTQPVLGASEAEAIVASHVRPDFAVAERWRPTGLAVVPLEAGEDFLQVVPGTGYAYRLVWSVGVRLAGDHGTWEALVDAGTGELLAFTDRNQYHRRKVVGGVYPVSNDGTPPDGVEQPGFPMPFADVIQPFGTSTETNSAGLVDGVGGRVRTTLNGEFIRINDNCGAIDEIASCTNLDLGTSAGTDCAVPEGHSAGDTHSARSGFYELNRIQEAARAQLPGNPWLDEQLTANMNINDSCNAFWDGQTVNFFKSSAACANTGEIAAVFDHEWGHGLDDNDNNPDVSSPGEAIADIYGILRLSDSCMGRGFFLSGTCSGYGDACDACTGVRDLDFANHASGEAHDIEWILSPTVAPGGGCVGVAGVQFGPCNQETHCEGMVPAEAGWDLFSRDLPAGGLDSNTSLEIATRLFFLGGANVGSWYQCTPGGLAGCNADGGYLNLLAADDDNGNLEDGTPHMAAIFAAFDRHQIACVTPAVASSGCAGAPSQAPALTASPLEQGAELSWTAVPGAEEYWVFRTEGVRGCEFGKVKIAETAATELTDTGLLDGFEYFYSVMPVAGDGACLGPMSPCRPVVPLAPTAPEPEGVLAFLEVEEPFQIFTGDGDDFLDNCEVGRFSFAVENAGSVELTDVRLISVVPVSHPGTEIITPLPAPIASSLAGDACGTEASMALAGFDLQAEGLAPDDTLELEFVVAAESAVGPVQITGRVGLAGTESDFRFFDSVHFDFEEGFDGWKLVQGTYTREQPGANVTLFHLASSSFEPSQCDEIQSPEVRLTEGSTLSLFNQFDIEPGTPLGFYDRANVGLVDAVTGERSTISPDAGRLYNAAGPNGVCVTAGEPGWAGPGPGFLESTWSSEALGAPQRAGQRLRLDVAYGTDPLIEGAGLQFDEVTLTDVDLQVADGQGDTCAPPPQIVASDDSASTELNTPVTLDVLFNDFTRDPPLAIDQVSQPAHGSVGVNADDTLTYTPETGFVGLDGFQYVACDVAGFCDAATVLVTVECPATPTGSFSDDFEPEADAGWAGETAANENPASTPWTVTADPLAHSLTNAFFSDASTLLLKDDRLVAPAQDLSESSRLVFWHRFLFENTFDGGVLEVSVDGGSTWVDVVAGGGSFVEGGYDGTIASGFGSPIAGRDAWTGPSQFVDAMNRVEVDLGAFAGLDVLVRWRLATDPFALGATPGTGWWIDDVTFTNTLEFGEECPLAPDAVDDQATTQKDTPVTVDVLANDSDPNGDPLTVENVTDPANGTATSHGDGTVTYDPDPGFTGTDAFDYDACDPDGQCDTATVTVTVTEGNNAPVAEDDSATTQEDTPVTLDVLANDSDPDGDPLTVTSVTDPANGTATSHGDGTVTYDPDPGFTGTDTFDYTVSDGELEDTATVTVQVEESPDGTGEPTKATGGGSVPDGAGEADFGFDAHASRPAPKGRLHYEAQASGVSLAGTVSSLEFPSASVAELSGPCELEDGSSCTYSVRVEDLGEPGRGSDRFAISVRDAMGSEVHANDGILTGGNIQIH